MNPKTSEKTRIKKREFMKVLQLHDSYNIDKFYPGEDKVREQFNLDQNHCCIDAAAHKNTCSWIIAEDKGTDLHKALTQIEKMVEYIETIVDSYVEQIYILLSKNTTLTHTVTKKSVLAKRIRKGHHKAVQIGSKKKSYVYVIFYGNNEQDMRRNIGEVERSGNIY